ncbi:MAG: ATP-dependent DNA helicase RecG [Candidatus Nanopelagicales bacterium]|nr:ATP-dependent DNA helicase RecG [Candidatus Nanopelagicales bacterium]MDZ4250422.1 ATP-dependent DNA helicase RecG [Candidatus Nanopelagicales bacterium]
MADINDRLTSVVGGRTAKALSESFGMKTVADLLDHIPRRYVRRGELTDLDSLRVDEHVTVMAQIDGVKLIPFRGSRNRTRIEAVVTDGTAKLNLTFFNQPWRVKDLVPGRRALFTGKVGTFRGKRQLAHPDYLLLPADGDTGDIARMFAGSLVAVYPATARVSSLTIMRTVDLVLAGLGDVPDPVPDAIRAKHGLLPLREALEGIHKPYTDAEVAAARRRLKYDEAFVLQAVLAQRRLHTESLSATPRPATEDGLLAAFDAKLPFELTAGQLEVGDVVRRGLACFYPMHRLLQGDVGSGKTVVALRAMLQVVDDGGQAAMLAPTEVLAQQHYRSLLNFLGPLAGGGMLGGSDKATCVALLTGSLSAAARKQALLDIASGAAGIAVGTHALLQDKVQFADLGLIVVDEQHRFGVEQRSALLDRVSGERPHLLVMTATPIPRTVAMTVFGDLETSTLRERPAGLQVIETHVVGEIDQPSHLERVWLRAAEEVRSGQRVFVVCPRIDDTGQAEDLQDEEGDPDAERPSLRTVVETLAALKDGPLSGCRIAALHGRLPSDEKDAVMRRFGAERGAADALDVVVATTVIEVGVDIAQASTMVIMDADRFGVSQLHQLRGRVGRRGQPGLCLLVTRSEPGSPARERLEAVAATSDGFELARIDLQQRREGDVLGTAQSGLRSSLRLLSVLRDEDVIQDARRDASEVLQKSPDLAAHQALLAAISRFQSEDRAEYLDKT